MTRIKALAIFNAISFSLQLLFIYLAQAGYLNIQTLRQANEVHQTMISPTGMSFGILGIIFTSISILCLYHIVMAYKHDLTNPANHEITKMGIWFILLNAAAIGWIMALSNDMMLISVIMIFLQLICLVIIHLKLNIYSLKKSAGVKVANQFPLSIYLAWITVIAILNTAAYLNSVGWDGLNLEPHQWAIAMITFLVLISATVILARKNIYFGIITAWFLFGIILKMKNQAGNANNTIYLAAILGISIVLILALYRLVRNIRYSRLPEIFPAKTEPLK